MTKGKAIETIRSILYQYESSLEEAKSKFAEEWQKESLEDNKDAVEALNMAIDKLMKK